MRYIHFTGLSNEKQKIDCDYIAGSNLDIEKMSLEQETGFMFNLPASSLPAQYTADSFAIKITANLKYDDGRMYVEDSSRFIERDLYWIKNELIEVRNVISATEIITERGMWGTFAQNYYVEGKKDYYITTELQTYVGLRVLLYEDNTLLTIGFVRENPKVESGIANFNCDGLEKVLDTFLPTFNTTFESLYENDFSQPLEYFWGMSARNPFRDELPPIADFLYLDIAQTYLFNWSQSRVFFPRNKFATIKDFIDFYSQSNLMVFGFDQSIGKFRFIPISAELSLSTTETRELKSFKNIEKSYTSQMYSGISKVLLTTDNGSISFTSPQANSFNSRGMLELDFSGFTNVLDEDLEQLGLKYINQFSIIYSRLSIPSSSKVFSYFNEGTYYEISNISEFYTFQSVSDKVLCIGKDDDMIDFLVLKSVSKAPVTPGIPITISSNEVTFGWASADFSIEDFLQTEEGTNLEDAELAEYSEKFFLAGDKVLIMQAGVSTSAIITEVDEEIITLDTSFLDGEYWLLWDSAATRQNVWFYYGIDEY